MFRVNQMTQGKAPFENNGQVLVEALMIKKVIYVLLFLVVCHSAQAKLEIEIIQGNASHIV